MSRLFAILGLVVAASAVRAGEVPPEKLLSPQTQVYLRWDGVTPHKEAYRNSVWGGIMKGPTGQTLLDLVHRLPQFMGPEMLGGPLLDGQPLAELRKVQTDLKLIGQLPDLIADHGAMVVVEVREPDVLKAVGGIVKDGAKAKPLADSLMPDIRFFLIVPNVGNKADALFAPTRLFNRSMGTMAKPLAQDLNLPGFHWSEVPGSPVQMAEWVIEGHYVEYVGSSPPAEVIATMRANLKNGGLTGHPLFQRALGIKGFESVARGFIDTGATIGMVKKLAGPLVPGLTERIDDTGLGNLQAILFSSGFDGIESKAVWEIDLPGERKGLAKILGRGPVSLADLPPLPPDCSRFSALRIDWNAAYDAGLIATEAMLMMERIGNIEQGKKPPVEFMKERREFLARELDKAAGISVKDDLVANLGDLFVMYQSPSEGLQVFGQVVAISCKNPVAVKNAVDRIQRAMDNGIELRSRVRKKTYQGVEMRAISSRDFGIVTPSYAVVGNWLVMAGNPQLVQGFILRSQGITESWKPDAATEARIAKLPADRIGLQYCNPKSTAQNMCCVGPMFLAALGQFRFGRDSYDPYDVGIVPNAHELSKHLFPNLVATRDDGRTIRIEVNESFSLPLDCIGFDPFLFAMMTASARF